MFGIAGIIGARRLSAIRAVADSGVVYKNGPTVSSGNIYTNDQNIGSSTVHLVYWTNPQTQASSSTQAGNSLSGSYGSVTVNANGSFSYQLNVENSNVTNLYQGETLTDQFSIDSMDPYGRAFASQLVITIQGFGSRDYMVLLSSRHANIRGVETPSVFGATLSSRAANIRGVETPSILGATLSSRAANVRGVETPSVVSATLGSRVANIRGVDTASPLTVTLFRN
jgi:VCBS repeat-containing protein